MDTGGTLKAQVSSQHLEVLPTLLSAVEVLKNCRGPEHLGCIWLLSPRRLRHVYFVDTEVIQDRINSVKHWNPSGYGSWLPAVEINEQWFLHMNKVSSAESTQQAILQEDLHSSACFCSQATACMQAGLDLSLLLPSPSPLAGFFCFPLPSSKSDTIKQSRK